MNNKTQHTNSTLRFRRWSRVGYAVFCSLSCCVSIGALAISVSDKTLQKSEGISMAHVHSALTTTDGSENDPVDDGLEATFQQAIIVSLSEMSSDSAAALRLTTSYIINCNG
jgi:hypothetical protein